MRKVGQRVRITVQLIDAADRPPPLGRALRPRPRGHLRDPGRGHDGDRRDPARPGRGGGARPRRPPHHRQHGGLRVRPHRQGPAPPQQARRQRPGAAPARAGDRARSRLCPRPRLEGLRARPVLGLQLVREPARRRGADQGGAATSPSPSTTTTATCTASWRRSTSIQEHYDQAVYHQRRALSLNPNDDLVVVQQGEMLTWLGQPDEGIEWIRKAMRLNPYHPERFWNHLARACFAARRYDEAIEALRCVDLARRDASRLAGRLPRAARRRRRGGRAAPARPGAAADASASASTWRACTTATRPTASTIARRSSARAFRPDPPGPARPGDNTADRPARASRRALPLFSSVGRLRPGHSHGSVRLHDEPRGQDRSAQAADPQEHLAVVLPRRQDRRARPERLGQVDPAQDHGRHRPRHRGRGDADAGPEDRLPAAGAAARPRPDRAPGGGGGHRRRARRQEAPRRGVRRLRRAGRRLRQARRRAGRARGADRRRRRREHRPAARDRRRRAAPGAVGRGDRQAVRRREAPRGAVPDAAVQARHAAARRADQPPRRRIGRLARAVPAALPRHRGGDHPRPLLPRQRRRVDPRARPRLGHSVQGQLLDLAGAEGSAPRAGAEDRGRAHQGDEEGARVGAPEPQGPPGQEQGADRPLRGALRHRLPEAQRDQRDLHPGRRPPRPRGDRVRERQQELRRPPADRRPELQGAGRRDRRHHRPERRRQVDPVPHDRRQGEARQRQRSRSAPTVEDGLRRAEPRGAGERQDGLAGRLGRPRQPRRRQVRDAEPRLPRAASTSRATTSRSWSATCRAASAGGCTWPRR